MALFCGLPGVGFILILVALVVVPALLWSGVQAWRAPAERRWRAARAGIVGVAFLIPAALHWHHQGATRRAADTVVDAVMRFRQQRGRYPRTLVEAGLPQRNREGIRYGLFPDGPFLIYPSSFNFFDKDVYDFQRHRWQFRSD